MFILNLHDQVPLYRQLYHQIREQVLSGELPAGSRLPSVRNLAVELAVSRATVENAYLELYGEGYLYSRPRSGYFVSTLDSELAPRSLAPVFPRRTPLPESSQSCAFDFHPARLDPASFPVALWRRLFLETLRSCARELTHYGDPQGDWGLRVAIRAYLERSRGVMCDPEQIVICAGLQQSLEIVAVLLKGDHSAVAVEDPGYPLPRSLFCNHGYQVLPLSVGPGGLDLDALQSGDGTVAYVTPSHQLPMGYVMPVANRLRLIEWAAVGNRMIIEDDYDSELRYHGRPIPSLQGLRPSGNIVYMGTFSKILSPALRVSYLVLPRTLLASYRQRFGHYFSTVSLLEQKTLASFMEQGHWERHIRRMRIICKRKHDALLHALERHFDAQAAIIGQGAGLHVAVQLLGHGPDEAELIDRARRKGVRLFPFSATCAKPPSGPPMVLLGFGGMTGDEIEQGIRLLLQAWQGSP
ncbi:PLP-dependent aminotransferase family protein [Geobacter sp. FeAm09]|uniref:MocR-like pyridoxine biosynthesis transcription factor PdxR n=1 Tax=Geobacter sp. FeAm09 TaxID=2597769 RepID=UPI0011ED1207|nr:PLP-dependent aminotransferase family protein [Geobacter sp. FeAm09]QEM67420.1 PLP-dependent aminotransferase family protein [Geobacter sp. FeAm09]